MLSLMRGFYACMIDDLRGTAGISYTIDDFIDPNIPLLYLLCHAYRGVPK